MLKAARDLKIFNNLIRGSTILVLGLSLTGCKNIFSTGGDDKSSADTGFAPGLDPIPKSFSIIDLTATGGTVHLTWQTSEFAGSYNVLYRKQGAPAFTKILNVSSPLNQTGIPNNFVYEFQVEAVNDRGSTLSGPRVVSLTNSSVKSGGFASASSQLSHTASGRIVQGSMGELTDKIKMVTTPNGYKVYSNIQGQLLPGTGGSQ